MGPSSGSTVDMAVSSAPQMVMDWPHHLVSGTGSSGVAGMDGKSVVRSAGMGCISCAGVDVRGEAEWTARRAAARFARTRGERDVDAAQPAVAEAPEVRERAVAAAADVGVGVERDAHG